MGKLGAEEVMEGLLGISDALISTAPFKQRMTRLCEQVTLSLGCDRSSIILWTGSRYVGAHSFGLPPEFAERFLSKELSDLLIKLLVGVQDYIILQSAEQSPIVAQIAEAAGLITAVVCPISDENGQPLAVLTAGFTNRLGEFDDLSAQLALGIARLVRGALLAEAGRKADLRSIISRRTLQIEVDHSEYERRRKIRGEIHSASMRDLAAFQDGIASLAGQVTETNIKESLDLLVIESAAAAASLGNMFEADSLDHARLGLAESLLAALRKFSVGTGWKTELAHSLRTDPTAQVQNELVKIACQALVNAELHANASSVTISLTTERDGTLLTVVDDGDGFDVALVPDNRFGLLSMRERAESVSGTCSVESQLGTGTTIRAWAPN